jgi:hypothetical protein
MKRITLPLLYLLLALTVFAQQKKQSDREHDGFIGPVKKVFVEWSPIAMSYRGDVPLGSRCRHLTNDYDVNGRLMRHSVYPGSCGADEILETYTYAADGSQTTTTLEIRDMHSPPPPGPMANPNAGPEEKGPPKKLFKYDASGRLSETAVVKPSGRVVYKYTYTYDDQGRMVELTGYDGDGPVSDRRVYGYKGSDRLPSSFAYYDGKGKVYERTVYSDYEFNAQGDWIKRKETSEETFNRRTTSWLIRTIEYYPAGKR